ncbi:hypothetical protein [Aurantimonas sp. VKM B-3413]|uniref:hypothetical protein n=1 Tax=Aurantimonas sp. VKM B-3413 TaxID=2779401 RepID=UPI001E5C8A6B|nr:hypothetical protein [Aurantimonas sp. VKM B-3413]MCB8837533.1 hypothetical protein [Aurantimonas sp. VKM B-3413]
MIRPVATALFAIAALGVAPAFAQPAEPSDPLPAWRSGPPADAVMEIGQRFECVGPGCPVGLSCLYALGPERPPGSYPIDIDFIMDDKLMPWSDYEFWLTEKAKVLRPVLAKDPLVRSDRFAQRSAPLSFTLGEKTLVRRDYVLASKLKAYSVPAYLWTVKGKLATMFCMTGGQSSKDVRAPIRELLTWLTRESEAPGAKQP